MSNAERFWDKVAEKYARRPVKDMQTYKHTLERTASYLSAEDKVLEIGCGTGSTALLLADRVQHITGSDLSSNMIAIAAGKAKDQKVANVDFVQSTLSRGRFEAGSFDAVLAFSLLHLLEDPSADINRVHALLKPGGMFISKTVCIGGKSRFWSVLISVLRALGFAPYVNFLTPRQLEDLIANESFQIVESGAHPAGGRSWFVVARKT